MSMNAEQLDRLTGAMKYQRPREPDACDARREMLRLVVKYQAERRAEGRALTYQEAEDELAGRPKRYAETQAQILARRPQSGASAETWTKWMNDLAEADKAGEEPPGGNPPRGDDPAAPTRAEAARAINNPAAPITLDGKPAKKVGLRVNGNAIRTALDWARRERDRTGEATNFLWLCQQLGIDAGAPTSHSNSGRP